METTKLSSKGQVILPAIIRTANQWKAGIEFAVEDTGEGVLLRQLKPFTLTALDEVTGCAGYASKVHSREEMDRPSLRKPGHAMHAVDTNVLVRLLTGYDAVRAKRATTLFKKESIFIQGCPARNRMGAAPLVSP